MMRTAILISALSLSACSVSFDPTGQPCDKLKQCLKGYVCDASNHCVQSGAATGSSGTTGTSGSGSTGHTTTGSSGTTTGTTGSTTTGTTGTTGSCAGVICPATQFCEVGAAGPRCIGRTTPTCDANTACPNPGEQCIAAAGAGTGICLSPCDLSAPNCPTGTSCLSLTGERGDTFPACVPTPAPQACSRSSTCGAGLACLPFDFVSPGSGSIFEGAFPILFCDTALSGAASGAGCSVNSDCASGLCIGAAAATGTCAAACQANASCASGSCLPAVEFNRTHRAMACITAPTRCSTCGACGPDAPDCDANSNQCVLLCNDASDVDPCGHGEICVGSGASYCSVSSAVCP